MKLLDRYVLRNFVEPFVICFSAFIAIWLIMDLNDNHNDFIDAHAKFSQVFGYYATQLPSTILISLPIGLLLALLFSLSSMSRRNEIISMLTAGRSVIRVLLPLFGVGLVATAACLWLNWEMAPHAERIKKTALKKIRKGKPADEAEPVYGHLFRDRQNDRTWFVRRFRPGESKFDNIHITQQDTDGRITKKWYAEQAQYDPAAKTWTLRNGRIIAYNENGDIDEANSDNFLKDLRVISNWTETPWRVSSSQLDAQDLGIPELREYLKYNYDFPKAQLAPYQTNLADRWALPISCFVVVLIAAPLGIVYNRRGVLAGVASAIFFFFALILTRDLFLALGKGGRLSPNIAPWIPDMVSGTIGVVLLWFRSTNRDVPSFSFKRRRK